MYSADNAFTRIIIVAQTETAISIKPMPRRLLFAGEVTARRVRDGSAEPYHAVFLKRGPCADQIVPSFQMGEILALDRQFVLPIGEGADGDVGNGEGFAADIKVARQVVVEDAPFPCPIVARGVDGIHIALFG